MTSNAIFWWGMFVSIALVTGLLLLGVKASLWWIFPLSFANGLLFSVLRRRYGR